MVFSASASIVFSFSILKFSLPRFVHIHKCFFSLLSLCLASHAVHHSSTLSGCKESGCILFFCICLICNHPLITHHLVFPTASFFIHLRFIYIHPSIFTRYSFELNSIPLWHATLNGFFNDDDSRTVNEKC